jgi:hypothetical protein
MSGVLLMALMGSGGGYALTSGSATFTFKSVTTYFYGYSNSPATASFTPATFGSISPVTFSGATVKAIYSGSPSNSSGQASSYSVIFSGNQSTGFFNTLTVNGTQVTGTLSAPSYNSTNNETTFSITLGSAAATVLGSNCTVALT